MREYTIFTDSTCDLSPELYAENGLEVFTMYFTLDGKEYPDGYPAEGEDMTLTGVFDWYEENGFVFPVLRRAELT